MITVISCFKPQLALLYGDFDLEQSILEQKISFLKGIAPFDRLSTSQLEKIAGSFLIRKYRNRDTMFHQRDSSCDFFVIQSGKVRIVTINEMGIESCLRVLGPGDVMGELSAFDKEPRSASAQAIGLCTIFVMRHNDFAAYMSNMPDLTVSFIQVLLDKLRWTTRFSHSLAKYDTEGRLLHLIIEFKERFGREIAAGKIYEIDLPLNQTDLASMVGARREWINRLLQQLRKNRLITYSRGTLTILDLPTLIRERDKGLDIF